MINPSLKNSDLSKPLSTNSPTSVHNDMKFVNPEDQDLRPADTERSEQRTISSALTNEIGNKV